MKHGKRIEYKTGKIRLIAYSFRKIINVAAQNKMLEYQKVAARLIKKPYRLRQRFDDKIRSLRKKEAGLNKALDNSICICPGCGRSNRVMIYNQKLGQWWCEPCFNDRAHFYHEMKPTIDAGGCVGDFDVEFHKSFLLDEGMASRN